MDPWKQAYEKEFGSTPDDDMEEHGEDVEAWRVSWQSAYDAGEAWATAMVDDDEEEEAS